MDIKENLAKNLVLYRKAFKLTQADLAEKLNYSDKAVSKWERGESIPDLVVVKQIADLFSTTVDALISEPKPEKTKNGKNINKKRFIICSSAAILVWLVAVAFFAFANMIFPGIKNTWLSFIIAIPITFIVLLTLTSVWGKNTWNALFASLLNWTLVNAIFLCLNTLLYSPGHTLWMIYLVGIPAQALIIFLFFFKKVK